MKEVDPDTAASSQRYAWNALTHYHSQQMRNLRCFVALSVVAFSVLLALLQWDAAAWLIVPPGLAWAIINLCLWAVHRELEDQIQASKTALQFLEEQRLPVQAKETAPHALRLFGRGRGGRGGLKGLQRSAGSVIYLLIALASLFLSGLPLLRGKLPGWEAAKPPVNATPPAPAPSNDRLAPMAPSQMPAYGNRPVGSLPGGAQRPPLFPRSFTPPPSGTPFHLPGFTPPPRPFVTPSNTRPFPGGPGGPMAPGNPAALGKPAVPMTPPAFSPPAVSPSSASPSPAAAPLPGGATPASSNPPKAATPTSPAGK